MERFAMAFPEDVTGAVILGEKADSGADVFNPAAEFILKKNRIEGFFLPGP
jgi:hypothetical protein